MRPAHSPAAVSENSALGLPENGQELLFCDLTQSYSSVGGGIRTYIHEKRKYILEQTRHSHLLIVPGDQDRVDRDGRATTVTIKSPFVPGSEAYRLLLRNRAVRAALDEHRPDVIETLDAYNLPWAALKHQKKYPEVAVLAGYRTDFPRSYVQGYGEPFLKRFLPRKMAASIAAFFVNRADGYASRLYRKMDVVYALSETMANQLRSRKVPGVEVLPLGVDLNRFSPERASQDIRLAWGGTAARPPSGVPILIYVGRLDGEKQPDLVLQAFELLPRELGAVLVLAGDGPMRAELDKRARELTATGRTAIVEGYIGDRDVLAQQLASADIYVSAMPHETFGISIIEAQACGLPVAGVRAGAMPIRVPPELGTLVQPGSAPELATAILDVLDQGPAEMGRRARLHVENNFAWDRTFEKVMRLYSKAIANRLHAA